MHRDLHCHHQFFCNKEMNEIYLSVFLSNIAESMISIFVPIYLYTLGYSVAWIIVFFLIGQAGNVLFAWPVAKIVARFGAKHAILISAPFLIIYYLGLRTLPDCAWLFFILPFGITFRSLFYNFGFDLNFIDHFERKKVGRELSSIANLSIFGTILSPLVAGWIIFFAGYSVIFWIGSVILVISVLPLFATKDNHQAINFTWRDLVGLFKQPKTSGLLLSFAGYAIESNIGRIIWPIFLIIILGTAQMVGYVAALAAFLTMAVILLAGKLIDKADNKKLLNWGTFFYFLGWVGSFFADSAFGAFFINSYRSIAGQALTLPWSALFYKTVNRETYFQLVVWRDIVFNFSRVLIMPFVIAIFIWLPYPFLISFGLAALFTLLYPLINRNDKVSL